jgi:hypothetical protein
MSAPQIANPGDGAARRGAGPPGGLTEHAEMARLRGALTVMQVASFGIAGALIPAALMLWEVIDVGLTAVIGTLAALSILVWVLAVPLAVGKRSRFPGCGWFRLARQAIVTAFVAAPLTLVAVLTQLLIHSAVTWLAFVPLGVAGSAVVVATVAVAAGTATPAIAMQSATAMWAARLAGIAFAGAVGLVAAHLVAAQLGQAAGGSLRAMATDEVLLKSALSSFALGHGALAIAFAALNSGRRLGAAAVRGTFARAVRNRRGDDRLSP